jgi:hypothetical protein
LAFYDFPQKYIKSDIYTPEQIKQLDSYIKFFKTVPHCVMYEGICFVSDRPTVLKIDETGRLHSDKGPALEYSDGYCLYMHKGIEVTQQIIDSPETLTIEQIDSQSNAEIKRIMMEKYGWGKYLKSSGSVLIDEYTDQLGHPVKLWKKELGENFRQPIVMIELTNSTIEGLYDNSGTFTPHLNENGEQYHKSYMFNVPPEITSAKKAHLWHCGFNPAEYDEIEFIKQT